MNNVVMHRVIPIYDVPLYIFFDLDSYTSHYPDEKVSTTCEGLCWQGDRGLVLMVDTREQGFVPRIVLHECYHLLNMVCEQRNMELGLGQNDEHLAYLLDYIYACVEHAYQQYKRLAANHL